MRASAIRVRVGHDIDRNCLAKQRLHVVIAKLLPFRWVCGIVEYCFDWIVIKKMAVPQKCCAWLFAVGCDDTKILLRCHWQTLPRSIVDVGSKFTGPIGRQLSRETEWIF